MKSIFRSSRHKKPHKNEESEKKEAPFFSKDNPSAFFASKTPVQTKLTVGQPGDKYEKEADQMADAVVNQSAGPHINKKEISSIQRESLATPQEDEKLGTAEQRMEEDKLVQEKPEIQAMEAPEEEEGMLNKMEEGQEEEGMVNKMEGEQEEEEPSGAVQAKGNSANQTASSGVSQKIKSKAGKGRQLSPDTRHEMESSFGLNFKGVNIHTDTEAVEMNKELGAQAFTHGRDIYFNSGKYRPETESGKHLLAHELTHVVQQNNDTLIQRQSGGRTRSRRRRRPQRQRVYVIRDEGIDVGGGTLVSDLRAFKRSVMRSRNTGEWTLVLSIHGSQDRLAAQSPPNWQENAIFYRAADINQLFNGDRSWVGWRDQYGPTRLSLVSCQVSASLENVLISNLVRQGEGIATQSAQGLGTGCKPRSLTADLDIYARNRRAFRGMSQSEQTRFIEQLSALNRRWGYYGSPPVPEAQLLDYFFDEAPRSAWAIVEVYHEGRSTGIPFWNRSSGSESGRFRRLCDQGVGRLRQHRPSVPPLNQEK